MFPVINLHRVDCKVCRSNLHECVQWGVSLTPAETAPVETTGPQPPIFINSEGEDESHLPLSPLSESPQHQGDILREDEEDQDEESEPDDDDDDEDDEDEDDDDWNPQGTMLDIFGRESNFTIRLPASSTEGERAFISDAVLDSLHKLIDPVHDYLRRQRTDRNSQVNPSGQSTSTTCTGSSFSVSNDIEEDKEMRLLAAIRSTKAKWPQRRLRSPQPFDYMVPEYGRDHPLLAMTAWKADAWSVSFEMAGDSFTPGFYPFYNTPPSTDASRTPNPDVSVTAQNDRAQHSSWPGNTPRDPVEVTAHSSSAAPAVGQSCSSQTEQSSSRKRKRETDSSSSSHSSETESSLSKMRRRDNEEE
ncbi:hypothetical protein P4O66_020418 [Electrophorus voltai]|uniref:Uncharacterized protein n=1 Tax=Electrophorus voltai TaxID=2609070 RepID=A0AAD9E710_9TELE|nr:hypothetical protein P4O66_020418 [Electrophorus voltai]